MSKIVTNSGREIPCSLISRGRQFPTLFLFTHAISAAEAWEIFYDNPAETERMVWVQDDGTRLVMRHYTQLHSIGPTTVATGEEDLLIWLDYYQPIEIETEEDDPNA